MAPAIRLLVLDVDGVLTDGRLYFGTRGEALKAFHVRDGVGLKQLQRAGLEIAVISGRRSPMVAARCRELGVPLMRAAALSFAVADAHRVARRAADVVTRLPGGRGAVREVCDHLLALNTRQARGR